MSELYHRGLFGAATGHIRLSQWTRSQTTLWSRATGRQDQAQPETASRGRRIGPAGQTLCFASAPRIEPSRAGSSLILAPMWYSPRSPGALRTGTASYEGHRRSRLHALGLPIPRPPDVVPMQQAAIEKLQQRMESAVEATTPEALLKAWMPIAPDQMQQAFAKLLGAFRGSRPADRG